MKGPKSNNRNMDDKVIIVIMVQNKMKYDRLCNNRTNDIEDEISSFINEISHMMIEQKTLRITYISKLRINENNDSKIK